jgi:hypothetical protein
VIEILMEPQIVVWNLPCTAHHTVVAIEVRMGLGGPDEIQRKGMSTPCRPARRPIPHRQDAEPHRAVRAARYLRRAFYSGSTAFAGAPVRPTLRYRSRMQVVRMLPAANSHTILEAARRAVPDRTLARAPGCSMDAAF